MEAFAKTDIGKAREMNQDYYAVPDWEDPMHLYILADGMGGYNGGEIASKLATLTALHYIKSNFDTIVKDKDSILLLIKSAMEYANMVVYEKAASEPELKGMGTTLEICLIYNNKIYIGHVGDSRIYRIRNELIRKLTHDHSYVEKLVDDGTITKEEASHHPKKNMLMKALGCKAFLEPDVTSKAMQKGDTILMCSDGLTNMLDEKEIYEIIKEDYKQAVNKLIDKANEKGGYDNITAIVIH